MASNLATTCRAFVGGFGRPGMRDCDFGRQFVDYLQQLDWPEGVVVEELSCAVPLVLHRLQELRPAKVVLLGAVPRGLDPPGTLRRYPVSRRSSAPEEVHRALEESVMGMADLDHTLAVARHWGQLPADTVVIEVEPADTSFGLGFSEELADCIDLILDMVRQEVGDGAAPAGLLRELSADDPPPETTEAEVPVTCADAPELSEAMTRLVAYAGDHAEARLQAGRGPSHVDALAPDTPGVELAGRVRPWGLFLKSGGDWFDAVPLGDGRVGIVVGNVPGRGAEATPTMSDLRAAVRACVVLHGGSPSRLVGDVDRLAEVTGLGRGTRLVYLILDPAIGEVRFVNAGGPPPLLLEGDVPTGRFVDAARSPAVGEVGGADRPEATVELLAGSTMLLFTDGLVESRAVPRAAGLDRLRRVAAEGPAPLEDLCDHVVRVCTRSLRRDDDVCLLGVRLVPDTVDARHPSGRRSDLGEVRSSSDVPFG